MFEDKKTRDTAPTGPPKVIDSLTSVISQIRGHRPKMMPRDNIAAAQFWIDHQEPADERRERPEMQTSRDGKPSWKCPYHARLIGSQRQFWAMDNLHQAWIIETIERGIPYRGDTIEQFKQVIEQAELYAKDKPAYIEKALDILANFKMRGMNNDH